MRTEQYHLLELEIALSPGDHRRIMPEVPDGATRILDVGCGAGQTLIGLDLKPGILKVGLDNDLKALTVGKRLDPTILFVCARGDALPFRDQAFDFVFSRLALFYMNVPRALCEIARVLDPGSRFWCALRSQRVVLQNIGEALRARNVRACVFELYAFLNGTLLCVTGNEVHCPFFSRRYASFQGSAQMTRDLKASGFDAVQISAGGDLIASARKRPLRDPCERGIHRAAQQNTGKAV